MATPPVSAVPKVTFVDHDYSSDVSGKECHVCTWLNQSWKVPEALYPAIHERVENLAQYYLKEVIQKDVNRCSELQVVPNVNMESELVDLFVKLFSEKTNIHIHIVKSPYQNYPHIHPIFKTVSRVKSGWPPETWNFAFMWSRNKYLKTVATTPTRKITYVPDPCAAYRQLFNRAMEGKDTDVTIKVGTSSLYTAHKVILCAFSTYFNTLLNSGMKEASTSTIEVNDSTPKAVKAYLEFLYTQQIEKIEDAEAYSLQDLLDILELAYKGMNERLAECCLARIQSLLTPENYYTFFQPLLSVSLSHPSLLQRCCEMITGNAAALGAFKMTLRNVFSEYKDWKKIEEITRGSMPDMHRIIMQYSEFQGEEWWPSTPADAAAAAQ